MARTKGKRSQRESPRQATVESFSEERDAQTSSEDPYEVQETPPASKQRSNKRSARKSTGRGEPTPAKRSPTAVELRARAAVGPARQAHPPQMDNGTLRALKVRRPSKKVAEGTAAVPRSHLRQEERVEAAPKGKKRQEAEGTAIASRGTTRDVDQEEVVAEKAASIQVTPVKRRSTPGTGQSAKKRRISPKKTATMIIPGSQLPNGAKHPLPKGTVMEMIQVRDLEVSRLMEELQSYEDEAMVLTYQIHAMSNEKMEQDQQIQEMARSMADMQRALSHMRLSSAIGPKLTYWPDEKINTYWDRLVNNVLSFAEDHCHWPDDGGIDGMSQYRPDAWKLGGSGEAGHFGTFQQLMDEKDPTIAAKIGITQSYVRKLTSDGLGNSYPARLDAFVGEGQPNELIPAAMIMRILQSEVFDKIRWLLRSEPFWDPMKNPNPTTDVDWESFKGRMTNDFVVLQERTSAYDDPSELFYPPPTSNLSPLILILPVQTFTQTAAFEFNCIRAKMMLHLMGQHDQLGTVMINYLNRVGVLILNAIHPFITLDCIHSDRIGPERGRSAELLRFEQIFRDDTPHAQRLQSKKKLHQILTGAWTLALLMRSDNTVTYLDGGGFNLPYDESVMQNIGAQSQNPALKFFRLSTRKGRYAMTNGTYAWLVVAPCLKRAGRQDGTGYGESRVISKSRMALRWVTFTPNVTLFAGKCRVKANRGFGIGLGITHRH